MGLSANWKIARGRLVSAGRDELVERLRQQMRARVDAVRYWLGADFAIGLTGAPVGRRYGFFFAPEEVPALCSLLKRRLPGQMEEVCRRAEKICHHNFDLLGYKDLDYGAQIDWHCDRVHGKRAPRKPWFQVRYFDFQEVGDVKVIWELNRHQHLVTLAKAYRLTGNGRFAEEILREWQHWHSANPYPIGINWTSSLEVAFRSLSWLWTNALLGDCPVVSGGFRSEWLRALAINGRHIEHYLSTYSSPNTHLLGEGVALFFIGSLCPELRDAERWKQKGWQIVLRELQRQVHTDGFHFEQSTHYHVYALDLFLHAVLLANLNGVSIVKEFEERLERMLTALLLLGRAGTPPQWGDDDGGRLFDPRRNCGTHMLDPLATGAVIFGRGDFKAAARELREETVWLLGEAGVAEWDRLEEQQPAMTSAVLPAAGLYMLTATRSQLTIDAGPQGAFRAGHGHADALSVCFQSNGILLLIDTGTFAYVSESAERDVFRGTTMHNTLSVDGADQSEPSGPFAWHRLAHAKTEKWICGETFDVFVGSHDGYTRLSSPVVHRRRLVALKSGLFLVWDVIEGDGKHRLDITWHLGPEVQLAAEHLFRVKDCSHGLAILPAEGHGWAEMSRKDVWSPVYGKKQPITVLNFGTFADVPAEFATLLVPLEEVHRIPGRFIQITGRGSSSPVRGYGYETETEEYFFYFGVKGQQWKHGSLGSDAEFVCGNRKRGGELRLLVFCDGSYVDKDGYRVVSCKRTVSRFELTMCDGNMELFSSDPEAIEKKPAMRAPATFDVQAIIEAESSARAADK